MGQPGLPEPLLELVPERDAGDARYELLRALRPSADPFGVAECCVRLDRIRARVDALATAQDAAEPRVNLTHAINKLIACAIDAHPEFNQIVCGRKLYQVRGVHVTNTLLLPGDDRAVVNVIVHDAHRKPLAQVARELSELKQRRREERASGRLTSSPWSRLAASTRVHRLFSERYVFERGLRAGWVSNVFLSNHYFDGEPAAFKVIKPVRPPRDIALRFHTQSVTRPDVVGGELAMREMLRLVIVIDHRVVHGAHLHAFCRTLEALADEPAESIR